MILNSNQLRERAREYALTNESTGYPQPRRHWMVFQSDMQSLHEFAKRLSANRTQCMQPAEDWLLDHIAFLETQSQEVIRMLPRKALHQLPTLKGSGIPRIYAICDDYLEHVDGRYDVRAFETYLEAYQEVSVLKTFECWALPIAMRVVIICRLAQAMREVRHRHEVCNCTAALLERVSHKDLSDEQVRAVLDSYARGRTFTPVEVVHLVRHLSEWEPNIQLVREWLVGHVETSEASLENMVSFEHQLQAELQVLCGNLVTSLHVLERQPWRSTFVKISHVEQILLSHQSGEYERLDSVSRDLLRDRVVELARRMNVPETFVAQTAVEVSLASRQGASPLAEPQSREACLAFYLLETRGVAQLRRALSERTSPRRLPSVVLRRRPIAAYVLGSAILFICLMLLAGYWLSAGTSISRASWIALWVALAVPVSEWVVTLVHAAIIRCCRPTPLLRYDFAKGLPTDARTMVVIPVIWSRVEEVDDVLDRLLVHYLANRQEHIHFAILADFADAASERVAGDDELVGHAVRQVKALQSKYGRERFFLFHRSRQLNPVDGVYMGWERKRGKLVEFVELLSGSDTTSFTTVHGQMDVLQDIRYILTVDHDTQLPIGAVSRLVATMHYPYNRPRLNAAGTRVVEGFGVLQPRITVSFDSVQKSRFAALWAGEPGIDPYAFAVSDPYQDWFGKAAFVGKGLFDVESFRKTVVDRIPDNRVLSHDLLEGGFLRTGLASDIEVVEEHPSTVYAHQRRAHRWIRGDWQLIKWLGRMCADRYGTEKPIDVCGVTRLQILDNLRRSLLAPTLFIVSLLGLRLLPGRAMVWELIVVLTLFLPFWRALPRVLVGRARKSILSVTFLQSAVRLMTLPFAAVVTADAIARALYRMYVSQRNLLEWVPANQMDQAAGKRPVFVYEPVAYLAMALFAVATWFSTSGQTFVLGAVGIVIWLLARPVVVWLNRAPRGDKRAWLTAARPEMEDWARQIWLFYERYVTADESWLPPDNVQYHPTEVIAHRTSPTNIGLYLASVVAARDLGFIDSETMLYRLQKSIETLRRLEKWNGHLLNWYDTQSAKPLAPRYVSTVDSGNLVAYLMLIREALRENGEREPGLTASSRELIEEIDQLVEETDFLALYNPDERLFCLGFHVEAQKKEDILYDLLASEARQASFVAIALGQVPVSHWFTLNRTMTIAGGRKTLLSWSGTMFEYMMPSLLMRTYRNTVWDSTYQGVVHRQQAYANLRRVPFGISESGYYAFDYQLNYQYRAFGVPGLGLDRGLERNLVVAPYATILALPYAGESAISALKSLEQLGAAGEFGFYEAVDFTVQRLPEGSRHQVIQSFMAHHQGMSMLTIANLLTDDVMIERFHANLHVRAANLLLQERIPQKAAIIEEPIGTNASLPAMDGQLDDTARTFEEPPVVPEVNVLSNGRMTSMSSTGGTGFLTWKDLAVTRWREDPVVDASGPVVYVHDVATEETWSTAAFPCQALTDDRVVFRLDKTVYEGRCHGISSSLETIVVPDVDAEIRRLRLFNDSSTARTLEVTSFLELAMASQSADSAHPAFSKLFVQTSHDADEQCLFAKRRPREEDEMETWAVHTMYVDGREAGEYEFETDRAAFIGRGYSLAQPKSIGSRLRGSVGSVADPAFVMRRAIYLAPGETASVYMVTGVAQSREEAVEIVHRLSEPSQADGAFHLAWVRSQINLRQHHLSPAQIVAALRLAGRLLYTPPLSHVRRDAIARNVLGQSALWSHGISGDAPILAVALAHPADLPFVTLLARQHQYLCNVGLAVDMVVVDETIGGYQDEMRHRLHEALAAHGIAKMERMISLKASQLSEDERMLLRAVARVWLRAGGPSLTAQLQVDEVRSLPVARVPSPRQEAPERAPHVPPEGEYFNGWGGFVEDGKAYQVHVQRGAYLPRPWTNVLANPQFGCLLTELGTGYSWWRNSRECKLTPWTNDPVLDRPGECLYLRDLDAGDIWSAAPEPAGGDRSFRVTHGRGYSRIEQTSGEVVHEMEMVVPREDPLKLIRLRLHNRSDEAKRIAVTYYAEWVLGVTREAQAPYIVTEWDDELSTLLARNHYQETFRDAVGFLHIFGEHDRRRAGVSLYSWTGDRAEFIGRGGTLACPAALEADRLSQRTGTFDSTCGAVQTVIELPAHGDASLTILFGCAASREEVSSLVQAYGKHSAYADTLADVTRHWERITGQIRVKTPDRPMDLMLNGWLLYQTLCCRMWARTAFYQAGGAFGFRDQLQDALALLHADPDITRRQILHNAAHQYREGDVQHWWHDETRKGIRTRYSDDLLWLPYAVSRYIEQTGDMEILNEEVPFLHSEVLKEDELERYEETVVSEERATILEHCLRAVRHASRFGEHGIPLMGIGDWNDGMNRVGAKGRGESVWLGWFLLDVLKRWIRLGRDVLSDAALAEQLEGQVHELEDNLNRHAWDGAWFRRAFTDEGRWLGSIEDRECRIDAIAQSWSVISQGASEERQERAMRSFDRELVDRDLRLARLLTKAFDETRPSPGYIQGYPPGIRENGGQYTHGVIWSIVAWAMLGRRDKAFELFSTLNPISHTQTVREVLEYGNEPYVMSADLYTAKPHEGRAGWSWYTGAAGWMYQAGLEYVLGVTRRNDRLYIQPCVPSGWDSFTVDYRYGESTYSIDVHCAGNGGPLTTWVVDGEEMESDYLHLVDDGQSHRVTVRPSSQPLSTVG
ncbi:GH36-type glycosyl hydrolase domain-containing protein [Alicyclobacillus fastidiosus]|uniref:Glucoamylase family protein n=1 Tax=Alicyclobacillus fastidiosus TaxID=392011 RepID=A0ABV5AIN4_9BACL|nr:glucoamylase family protein [Alicyclobacillus fastidiosus]WEH07808.1 glucoamylase family protein [Alicyclobacillus fastidiosus]